MLKYVAWLKRGRVFALLALLSFLSVLILGDDCPQWNGRFEVSVSHALAMAQAPRGSAIIDRGQTRLVFLNPQHKVVRLAESLEFGRPTAYYSAVAAAPDGFYVSQYSLHDNSRYLKKETVRKYGFDGKCLGEVLSAGYTLGKDRTLQARFTSIALRDGQGLVAGVDSRRHQVFVWKFPADPRDKEADAKPVAVLPPPADSRFAIGAYLVASQPGRLAVLTNTHRLYWFDWEKKKSLSGPQDYGGQDYLRAVDIDAQGQVRLTARCAAQGRTFAFHWSLALREALFCLSALYLAGFLLWALGWGIRTLARRRDPALVRRLAAGATAFAVCLGITAFYTVHAIDSYKASMDKALREAVYLMEDISPNPLVKALEESRKDHTLSDQTCDQVLRILEGAARDMLRIHEDLNFQLIAYDDSGRPFVLQDSVGDVLLGAKTFSLPVTFKQVQESSDCFVMEQRSTWGRYWVGLQAVRNPQGETIGAVSCFADANNLSAAALHEGIALLMTLLPAALLIAFLLSEGKAALQCFFLYRKARLAHAPHAEFYMARPATFLLCAGGMANTTLFAVVVKEMSQGANSYLVAGVMTVYFLGYLAGTYALKGLSLVWSQRRIILAGTAAMGAFFLVMFEACLADNLWLFVAGAFLANACYQACNVSINAWTYHAPDSAARTAGNRAVSIAHLSALTVAAFVTGALSHCFGNAAIELYAAVMAVAAFGLLYAVVPAEALAARGGGQGSGAAAASSFWKSVQTIFCSGRFLALMGLVLLPCTVLQAYKSYIFPLYAYDLGMNKAMISNMIVICGALVFYCSPVFAMFERKYGSRTVLLLSGFTLAGTFMMFLANQSAVWAVATLFVSNFAFKTMDPSIFSSWQELTISSRVDIRDSQILNSTLTSALTAARAPAVCACLQGFGQILGCFALGAWAMASLVAYAVLSRPKR